VASRRGRAVCDLHGGGDATPRAKVREEAQALLHEPQRRSELGLARAQGSLCARGEIRNRGWLKRVGRK
jgi:hypothetical protein